MAESGNALLEGANGCIGFDGEIVTITRKGLRAISDGKNGRQIRLADIQRVDFEEPSFARKGYIRFAVPGEIHNDVAQDRNCVLFTKKQTTAFAELRDQVRAGFTTRSQAERDALRERSSVAYAETTREQNRSDLSASYGGHSAQGDLYTYPHQSGHKFKTLSGATALFESGADKSRPTLTRVGTGALIAGPAGAVVGALFKKNTSQCYVTVVFSDGDTAILEGPIKDESKMRQFAADVNRIAA